MLYPKWLLPFASSDESAAWHHGIITFPVLLKSPILVLLPRNWDAFLWPNAMLPNSTLLFWSRWTDKNFVGFALLYIARSVIAYQAKIKPANTDSWFLIKRTFIIYLHDFCCYKTGQRLSHFKTGRRSNLRDLLKILALLLVFMSTQKRERPLCKVTGQSCTMLAELLLLFQFIWYEGIARP